MTVRPAGTVTVMPKVALSFGLSFTGYQPGEPCGSLTTYAPSRVGIQPSSELVRIDDGLLRAAVDHPHREVVAGLQLRARADRKLLALVLEVGRLPVDPHALDRQEVTQVEVEPMQVLGCSADTQRGAVEALRLRRVLDRQRVVLRVVPAVASEREVRVTGAVGPGDVALGKRRSGGDGKEGSGEEKCATEHARTLTAAGRTREPRTSAERP